MNIGEIIAGEMVRGKLDKRGVHSACDAGDEVYHHEWARNTATGSNGMRMSATATVPSRLATEEEVALWGALTGAPSPPELIEQEIATSLSYHLMESWSGSVGMVSSSSGISSFLLKDGEGRQFTISVTSASCGTDPEKEALRSALFRLTSYDGFHMVDNRFSDGTGSRELYFGVVPLWTDTGPETTVNRRSKFNEKAIAFADSHNLVNYIVCRIVYEQRGWKSEEREATEFEIEMWRALGGPEFTMADLLRDDL